MYMIIIINTYFYDVANNDKWCHLPNQLYYKSIACCHCIDHRLTHEHNKATTTSSPLPQTHFEKQFSAVVFYSFLFMFPTNKNWKTLITPCVQKDNNANKTNQQFIRFI